MASGVNLLSGQVQHGMKKASLRNNENKEHPMHPRHWAYSRNKLIWELSNILSLLCLTIKY